MSWIRKENTATAMLYPFKNYNNNLIFFFFLFTFLPFVCDSSCLKQKNNNLKKYSRRL